MMADAPWYKYENGEKSNKQSDEKMVLTDDNASEIMNFLNNFKI